MKIENSLQWNQVKTELLTQIAKLPYDPSIRRAIKNIDTMVTELSKIEVEARRTKTQYYKDAQLTKINEAIKTIDKILVLAILMS